MCDCECALKNNAKFRISREIFALIYQKALGQNKKPEKRSAQREPKYKNKKKKPTRNSQNVAEKMRHTKWQTKATSQQFLEQFFSSASGINTFELTRQGRLDTQANGDRRLEAGGRRVGARYKSCVHVPHGYFIVFYLRAVGAF